MPAWVWALLMARAQGCDPTISGLVDKELQFRLRESSTQTVKSFLGQVSHGKLVPTLDTAPATVSLYCAQRNPRFGS